MLVLVLALLGERYLGRITQNSFPSGRADSICCSSSFSAQAIRPGAPGRQALRSATCGTIEVKPGRTPI